MIKSGLNGLLERATVIDPQRADALRQECGRPVQPLRNISRVFTPPRSETRGKYLRRSCQVQDIKPWKQLFCPHKDIARQIHQHVAAATKIVLDADGNPVVQAMRPPAQRKITRCAARQKRLLRDCLKRLPSRICRAGDNPPRKNEAEIASRHPRHNAVLTHAGGADNSDQAPTHTIVPGVN